MYCLPCRLCMCTPLHMSPCAVSFLHHHVTFTSTAARTTPVTVVSPFASTIAWSGFSISPRRSFVAHGVMSCSLPSRWACSRPRCIARAAAAVRFASFSSRTFSLCACQSASFCSTPECPCACARACACACACACSCVYYTVAGLQRLGGGGEVEYG